MSIKLSNKEVKLYEENGYLVIPAFFNADLTSKLHDISIQDKAISENSFDLNDRSGKKTKLALWYEAGDDVFGKLMRCKSMISAVDKLLDGSAPVCHFHSKLMQKEPKVGGAWEWHQDFGYWYKNGFLFPNQMVSSMVALTEATKHNGCLQIIEGSHKMGRLEHGITGEQTGASERYVEFALKNMDVVYVELNPGDVVIFHSNVLHRSEANLSEKSRWSLITVYNRQTNDAFIDNYPSCTEPLLIVPDHTLLELQEESEVQEISSKFLKKSNISDI